MAAYARIMLAAMAAEVLLTLLAAAGIYCGFAVYPAQPAGIVPPVTQTAGSLSGGFMTTTTSESASLSFTLPVGMPSLQDLKMAYTSLLATGLTFGAASFLLSAAAFAALCFLRGAYLGGLRGMLFGGVEASLLRCGRYFFWRMARWSAFQLVAGLLAVGLAAILFPFGLIAMLLLFVFSLTPYLIVLRDAGVTDSLRAAPGLFRRSFARLLPLALLAMFVTFLCSFLKASPQPWGYLAALFVYVPVGTLLIRELLMRLVVILREERVLLPLLPQALARRSVRPIGRRAAAAGIAALPLLGAAAGSGLLIGALPEGAKTEWRGTGFLNGGFSTAAYASDRRYATYEWMEAGADRIRLRLPDLTDGRGPAVIRGTAEISWTVMEERIDRYGTSTHHGLEEARRTDRLFYRLARETTETGGVYYSSRSGTAFLLTPGGKLREPHRVDMMVSGDGAHAFVLLYPARFDAGPAWRVSADGSYLIPRDSPMNPTDFRTFWFSAEPNIEDVFRMLREKNRVSFATAGPQPQRVLPAALQEADGDKVVEVLDAFRVRTDPAVAVSAPDWDAARWTAELRGLYDGSDDAAVLEHLAKAARQNAHREDAAEPREEGAYRVATGVPFPRGRVVVEYEEKDGIVRELAVRIERLPDGGRNGEMIETADSSYQSPE